MGSESLKEEEIELELGLSLRGTYKQQKPERKPDFVQNVSVLVISESNNDCGVLGVGQKIMDPKTKREIQALRRHEAKKKREEKKQRLMKKGIRKRDFQDKDTDFNKDSEPESKRTKTEETRSAQITDGNLDLGTTSSHPLASPPVHLVFPVQYPYPFPYPIPNGFVYPCASVSSTTPCWFRAGGDGDGVVGKEGNVVVKPVVGYGFGPFQVVSDTGLGNRYDSELNNDSKDDENREGGSIGSSFCSSSAGSDHKSSSLEGGESSDTRSQSSYTAPDQWNGSKLNNSKSLSEHGATSHSRLKDSGLVHEETNHVEETVPTSNSPSSQTSPNEESKPETQPHCTDKNILTTETTNVGVSGGAKGDIGKPPKPQAVSPSLRSSLPNMPCVSTTGNGPNGKTINGFLYRYTKSEVVIVCVCHGSSFSPADFVHHAGGADVSNPLKHITVIPSNF